MGKAKTVKAAAFNRSFTTSSMNRSEVKTPTAKQLTKNQPIKPRPVSGIKIGKDFRGSTVYLKAETKSGRIGVYDRSEINKIAWGIAKSGNKSFGMGLKEAWAKVKTDRHKVANQLSMAGNAEVFNKGTVERANKLKALAEEFRPKSYAKKAKPATSTDIGYNDVKARGFRSVFATSRNYRGD